MFRNYRVVFLSDATATFDYPDSGFGSMPNADVHHATLVILARSTAHVMPVNELRALIERAGRAGRDIARETLQKS
jgi:ureidoacrylate peracid hydrolase